jgi:hypothetical protein
MTSSRYAEQRVVHEASHTRGLVMWKSEGNGSMEATEQLRLICGSPQGQLIILQTQHEIYAASSSSIPYIRLSWNHVLDLDGG